MSYEEIMETLTQLRFEGERGYPIILSQLEIEAIEYSMSAVKTLQDLPTALTELLKKGEDDELLQDD